MAFGLLAGNVFLVHTASNNNLGSLKMVEVKIENHFKYLLKGILLACKQKHRMYYDVSWNDCV